MKARVRFIILMAVCLFIFLLASCGEENIASRSSTTMDNPDVSSTHIWDNNDVSSTHIGDNNDIPHTHQWKETNFIVEPTCTESGKVQKKCGCGCTVEETVDPLGHSEVIIEGRAPSCNRIGLTEGKKCAICGVVTLERQEIEKTSHTETILERIEPDCLTPGKTEGKQCSVCKKIILAQEIIPAKGHLYGETNCIICGIVITPSQGLKFTPGDDGASYTVSGIGTCEDENIIIPSEYNGLPVTKIGANAFYRCDNIKSVKIPEGVTNIDTSAFTLCSLTSIYLPSSIKRIDGSFGTCIHLKSVHIADLAKWCEIDFPLQDNNPMYYAKELYIGGKLVTDIIIPDTVTKINKHAFYFFYNSAIKSVTIPKTVTVIERNAFVQNGSSDAVIYCEVSEDLPTWAPNCRSTYIKIEYKVKEK